MPIERGFRTGMGGFEHELLRLAGKAGREIKYGAVLRIDKINQPTLFLSAPRFERGKCLVIDMIIAVIIFLCGRKYEPRACYHPVDGLAKAVHLVAAVGREVDKSMVGAWGGTLSGGWHVERVDRLTNGRGLVPLNRQIGIGSNSSYGLSNQPLSGRNEKRSKRTGAALPTPVSPGRPSPEALPTRHRRCSAG